MQMFTVPLPNSGEVYDVNAYPKKIVWKRNSSAL